MAQNGNVYKSTKIECMKTVYTDGSCIGNPGPGGWAYAVPSKMYKSGYKPYATNSQMELMAVIKALENIDGKLLVFSDSEYVCNAFNKGWLLSWATKNWRKSDGRELANKEMWQYLFKLTEKREIEFRWVKAHSGDKWNSAVDRLAEEAARSQTSQCGKGDPFPDWDGTEDYKERRHYGGSAKATEKQVKYALALMSKAGQRPNMKELESMTKSEIFDLIDRYKK